MRKLMNLKIDFAFKQLFGEAGDPDILISFLNLILKLPPEQTIRSVEFIKPELPREFQDHKTILLDLLVKTEQDVHINVEIQYANQRDMDKRTLYYWSRVYSSQLQMGGSYIKLSKTITINILNFRFLPETDRFHTTFQLYEDHEQFPLTDVLEVHFIEIPKVLAKWKKGEVSPRSDRLACWMLLFEAHDNLELQQELEAIAMEDAELKALFKQWDALVDDKAKWWAYEMYRKAHFDENHRRVCEELDRKEAREAGLKEGREAGMQQGMQQGIAEGEERMASQVVKNLLQNGIEMKQIANLTGLPLDTLEKIREQMH